MIFDFNNDIDIIYVLDYFIRRDSNNLKIYNPSNFNFDLNDLDNLYKNYLTENEIKEIENIGNFANKAIYVLNNKINIEEYDKFNDYFNKFKIREQIKKDILSNLGLKKLDLNYLENIECNLKDNLLKENCYNENQLGELIVRVLEILLSSKFLGKDYYEWALNVQDSFGFTNVRKIFDIIGDEIDKINNLDMFFKVLLQKDVIKYDI